MLVLGGARSGKSTYAEWLAAGTGDAVVYLATAVAGDDEEMHDRIARHRAQRPATWRTVEAQTDLAPAITTVIGAVGTAQPITVVVEDLTLLLTNVMMRQAQAAAAEAAVIGELEALLALSTRVVLVSNEVGMGIVPAYPLGRQFRDALGRLNQRAAALCDRVYFVVAGLPQQLK